jgi:hypothetical protein
MIGQPTIDLSRYSFQSVHGEFTLYGSWVYNEDQEDYEPALIIVPAYRTTGFKPCVVALSAAYKYDTPEYCWKAAGVFTKALGMDITVARSHTLASLIYGHLLDLLKMPLSPTESIIVGEAVIGNGDGTSKTVLIQDHVPLAQA